jgi:hypothetical protein
LWHFPQPAWRLPTVHGGNWAAREQAVLRAFLSD